MKLFDYIKKHYNSNITHFSKDNELHRQNVQSMLRKKFYYVVEIEGKAMLIMGKKRLVVDKLNGDSNDNNSI